MIQASCVVPDLLPGPQFIIIPKDELQFIRNGDSNKKMIVEKFGQPHWTAADDLRWIYILRDYHSRKWMYCIPGPGGGACGRTQSTTKTEFLDIRFDKSGAVTDWSTPAAAYGECIEKGICP